VPAAAGVDGRNGVRGTPGSGREVELGGCAGAARRARLVPDWTTVTLVMERDSSWTNVRLCSTVCLRTKERCLAWAVSAGGAPTAGKVRLSTRLGAVEAAGGTAPASATTPASSRCTSTVGGGGIDGIEKTGNGGRSAGTDGGTGGGGNAGWAPGSDVAPELDADALEAALAAARFDWVTSPSFPGLAIRIETATLHCTQTEGTAAAGGGAPPGQSHCQFQIQIVDPVGGAGTAGAELGSQFQLQFQIQTSGGLPELVFGASGAIPEELSPAVLPPVSAAAGPVGAASGAVTADSGAVGAGAAPLEAPCATGLRAGGAIDCVAAGRADGDGSGVGDAADTTGGIAGEITVSGRIGATGALIAGSGGAAITTAGRGGAAGAGTTTAGSASGAGMIGALTPPEANAVGEAAAPSASAPATMAIHLATLPSRRAR
jgi:hypothetical protein